MKKVFMSLAVAALFSMTFVACQPKTEEEGAATDTVAVEQPIVEEPVAAEEVPAETPAETPVQ